MGTQLPLPQRGTAPQFSAHICCGQTAAWIKMVLGMEVGLSPGYFVLDGDPAPLLKKEAEPPPQFLVHFYCGQTAQQPPTLFGPCLLWPRLPISATAELLLGRELGPHLTQIPLGWGLPPYQLASRCIQPFGHNINWSKLVRGLCPPPFWGGGAGCPSNTKSPGRCLPPTKWHLDPCSHLAATDIGRNLVAVPFWERVGWVPV